MTGSKYRSSGKAGSGPDVVTGASEGAESLVGASGLEPLTSTV